MYIYIHITIYIMRIIICNKYDFFARVYNYISYVLYLLCIHVPIEHSIGTDHKHSVKQQDTVQKNAICHVLFHDYI